MCLTLAGCGGAEPSAHTVSGLVSAETAVSSVSLTDSSAPAQERTSEADADGAFSFEVSGLTPPFVLTAVDAAGTRQAALALAEGRTNIDAVTTAAYSRPSGSNVNWDSDRYESMLRKLRTVLSPLFQHYGITKFDDDATESRAFRAMLKEVSFTVASGALTVTNRATGGVIYSASLSDVASGVLHPENIPGGDVTPPPPPPSACTYTYSAWGACQSSSTQTRTLGTSTPAGCTGTPVLSQSCVYTPPVLDGAALYTQTCASCHGPLATSTKLGRTAAQITAAGMTKGLTPAQVQAVAAALAVAPPPPVACTYTTGAWGACQPNGTQSRTVSASPSGCTGTPPASSQSCTYVPPVVTCTAFTYSAFTPAVCPASGQQTRTVATSSPAGCTGGAPVLAQSCTYVPPVTTCSSFTYSAWSTCSAGGTQTRTVVSSAPAGCTGGNPVLSVSCTYVPPVTNPVTTANIVSSCTGCHGLVSNTTTFRSGGYSKTGASAATWLSSVNSMINGQGVSLAPGTTAQNYADFLAAAK
jgi:cytochrome c553